MDADWSVAMATAVGASVAVAAGLARRAWRGLPIVTPRAAEPVTWDGGDVLWVAAVAVLAHAAVASLGPQPPTQRQAIVAGMLATAVALSLGVLHLRRRGATWAALGFRPDAPGTLVRQAVGTVLLVVAPLLALAGALHRLVPYRHPIIDFLAVHGDPLSIGIVWGAAVVVAPVAEEFFFRRVLQGWLERWLERTAAADAAGGLAIVGAALAFALAHLGQGLAWIPLVVLGVVLGALARQTGSIVPAILAHALFNAVSLVILLLQPEAGS